MASFIEQDVTITVDPDTRVLLGRIADALERANELDPLAVMERAIADAPERVDLPLFSHSLGGGRWVATVSLERLRGPGWALDLASDPTKPGGVHVTLSGPGERYVLGVEG